jgi:hypothetical protein
VKLPTDVSGQELVKVLERVGFLSIGRRAATSYSDVPTPMLASSYRRISEFVLELSGRF